MNRYNQHRVYVIAEAGVNHNGDLDLALALVDAAQEAGADAVKFQTFKATNLLTQDAPKANYQKRGTGGGESQYAMLKRLELSAPAHRDLLARCAHGNLEFLSSPFDQESLDFLVEDLKLPKIKLGSGEITNAPLLLRAARFGRPIILSTGMSTLGEIEDALGVLAFGYLGCVDLPSKKQFERAYCSKEGQARLRTNVTLLHCTSEYPASYNEVNLRAMDSLRHAFGLPVGFSDHTVGISVPIAAVALGAVTIEKHFTLKRTLPGPDHMASLEPQELKEMVAFIRQVECSVGHPLKAPVISEMGNSEIARKSLVAISEIAQGDEFTETNLGVKRPGTGTSPFLYWDYIGRRSARSYRRDE